MPSAVASAREIAQAIANARELVLVTHINPDPDAFGSMLGLGLGIRAAGLEPLFVHDAECPQRLSFLPAVSEIKRMTAVKTRQTIVVCDCGDERRVGDKLKAEVLAFPTILNIDHHISNTNFGTLNFVVDSASSTSELVHAVLVELRALRGIETVNADVATCLLAGIVGDTGSFQYTNTSAATFRLAADLIDRGADLALIGERLFQNASLASVKLQAEALVNVELLCAGKVALVSVTREMLLRHNATSDDTEELVERARSISGVLVSVFLREESDVWKVSLRSKSPERYNMSQLAQRFGGGGHVAAAGFRFRGQKEELQTMLRAEIERMFN